MVPRTPRRANKKFRSINIKKPYGLLTPKSLELFKKAPKRSQNLGRFHFLMEQEYITSQDDVSAVAGEVIKVWKKFNWPILPRPSVISKLKNGIKNYKWLVKKSNRKITAKGMRIIKEWNVIFNIRDYKKKINNREEELFFAINSIPTKWYIALQVFFIKGFYFIIISSFAFYIYRC